MRTNPLQGGVVGDQLAGDVPDLHHQHDKAVERIDLSPRTVPAFDPLKAGISGVLAALDLIGPLGRRDEGKRSV